MMGVFVWLLVDFLNDEEIGKRVVLIILDEVWIFGLDALFCCYGIYLSCG